MIRSAFSLWVCIRDRDLLFQHRMPQASSYGKVTSPSHDKAQISFRSNLTTCRIERKSHEMAILEHAEPGSTTFE